eukprot:6209134-Pleurochrysis_carterae.AAC.4
MGVETRRRVGARSAWRNGKQRRLTQGPLLLSSWFVCSSVLSQKLSVARPFCPLEARAHGVPAARWLGRSHLHRDTR